MRKFEKLGLRKKKSKRPKRRPERSNKRLKIGGRKFFRKPRTGNNKRFLKSTRGRRLRNVKDCSKR